jgi:hypothetical protein
MERSVTPMRISAASELALRIYTYKSLITPRRCSVFSLSDRDIKQASKFSRREPKTCLTLQASAIVTRLNKARIFSTRE